MRSFSNRVMRSSSTAALAIVAIISLQLQLQLNNYHKITLCVRLDAQEGQGPSIKFLRATVGGTLPKQAVGHCKNHEPHFLSLNIGRLRMRPQGLVCRGEGGPAPSPQTTDSLPFFRGWVDKACGPCLHQESAYPQKVSWG